MANQAKIGPACGRDKWLAEGVKNHIKDRSHSHHIFVTWFDKSKLLFISHLANQQHH